MGSLKKQVNPRIELAFPIIASVLLALAPYSAIARAIEQERGEGVGAEQYSNSRFSMDSSWPPQPLGIEGIKWGSDSVSQRTFQQNIPAHAKRRIRGNRRAQRVLGERYAYVGNIALTDLERRSNVGTIRATCFSHSRNRSVVLEIDAAGEVKILQDIAASSLQPELARTEIANAVELARADFFAKGYQRISTLQGFGSLPYKPDSDHGFYDVRMVYVSFHERQDARPEFNALVDLTHQAVVESREDKP